jgi:hypothetical protein
MDVVQKYHKTGCTIYNTEQQQSCTAVQNLNQKEIHPIFIHSPNPPGHIPVKVILLARPLLTEISGANMAYSGV